jgi:HEAT repeat protein
MLTRFIACLVAGIAVLTPVRTCAASELDPLVALAATYESGGSEEPLRRLEKFLCEAGGAPERRAELEHALFRLLAPEATFEAKRFACLQLAVHGSEASLPALAALLEQEETVGIACFAFGGMRSPKAGDVLRAALPKSKGTARLQLVGALGRRAEPASVQPLVALASDADGAVACAAIRALGAIDAAPAREAVAALRRAAAPAMAAVVAEASLSGAAQLAAAGDLAGAAAIGEELLKPALPPHIRRGALGLLLRTDADGGMARARTVLTAAMPDDALVPVAIARVPELRGEGVSKSFGGVLPRLPPAAQVLLIEALACRADADARSAIQAQVGGADPAVRQAAIVAVGTFGDASAVALLAKALTAAVTPQETKDLQRALAGLRGGEATDRALCDALRRAAAKDKPALMTVLSRRGGREAVSALLEQAREGQAQRAAAQALARIADSGDSVSFEAVKAALSGGDARVREAALRTLVAWRGLAAWDTLAGIYLTPDGEAQHALALRGLIRIANEGNAQPDAALLARYRQLLSGARSDEDRKQILRVLAGVAHPDALAMALPLLDVPGVHGEAVEAVQRMASALMKAHPEAANQALRKLANEGNVP